MVVRPGLQPLLFDREWLIWVTCDSIDKQSWKLKVKKAKNTKFHLSFNDRMIKTRIHARCDVKV